MLNISTIDKTSIIHAIDYKDNTIVFSNFNSFYKPICSEGISIKYAKRGIEYYTLNKKQLMLCDNEYFISNLPLDGNVNIESKKQVQGICINISYKLIHEIESSLLLKNEISHSKNLDKYSALNNSVFNLFHLGNNSLSHIINKLSNITTEDEFLHSDMQQLFFKLGEAFILEQQPLLKYNLNLLTTNQITKVQILKQLMFARDYIEANFCDAIPVIDMAVVANMSEYHFLRTFKTVFGISPNQYQTKLRLEKAKQLLSKGMGNVQETAYAVGYSDIHIFSKAFKRYFGLNPSACTISRN